MTVPSSSFSDLKTKLAKLLAKLNSDFSELPDFVDIHLDNTQTNIRALSDTLRGWATTSSDVLDFANRYIGGLQSVSHAISITERELAQSVYSPITNLRDKSDSDGWLMKWLMRADFGGLLTCLIILTSVYFALSMEFARAISIGGMVIVILGLIYEAQYLPRFTSTGEFRAKTIGAGVPRNNKRHRREFFVTHFGFFQIILGTALSSIGFDLIEWLN